MNKCTQNLAITKSFLDRFGGAPQAIRRCFGKFIMESIEATFETLTPMFLGGAEQTEPALRPASVSGALAFWWRALHAHEYVLDDPSDLRELQSREAQLFGGDWRGGKSQSKVLVSCAALGEKIDTCTVSNAEHGRRYLGYGVLNANPERKAIVSGTHFKVKIRFHPTLKPCQRNQVIAAVQALGLFGGLGARVRRGWGALKLINLESKASELLDQTDYVSMTRELLSKSLNFDETDLLLTAFGQNTRICIGPGSQDANTAHNALGLKYKEIKQEPIGLPQEGWSINGNNAPERRASPLWITVRQIGDGFHPIIVLFGNKFLPDNIAVKESGTLKDISMSATHAFDRFLTQSKNGKAVYKELKWSVGL